MRPVRLGDVAAMLAYVAVAIACVVGAVHSSRVVSGRVFLVTAATALLATRVAWLLAVPTAPVSDFQAYLHLAGYFGDGHPPPVAATRYYLHAWGYPFFLAGWQALFGRSVVAAQALNVVCGLASMLVWYRIGDRAAGSAAGRVGATLFILWPAGVMYSSVCGSEHLALLLALVGLERCLAGLSRDDGRGCLALGGAALAAAFAVRPALISAAVAAGLTGALVSGPARRRLARLAMLGAGFGLACLGYAGSVRILLGSAPPRPGPFNLLVGTNLAAGGRWNEEDRAAVSRFATLAEFNDYARREAVRRVRSNPVGFLRLMVHKSATTWGSDAYAPHWSLIGLRASAARADAIREFGPLCAGVCASFHAMLLGAAALGVLLSLRRGPDPPLTLLLALMLLAGSLVHAISETQERYHFVLEPCLLWPAVIAITHRRLGRAARSNDAPTPRRPSA